MKRVLLYALVGSVIGGAVLGIALVLRGEWGWLEVRVILTTVTIAVASLCGLACDLSKTPRGRNLLPQAGLALTLLTAAMILGGMWLEFGEEFYWKSTVCLAIFAVATVHVCLLSIAKLAGRFRWVYFVATQVIFGLASLLTIMVIWEVENEQLLRFVITLSIVDAALTLIIPLLHRISRTDSSKSEFLTPLEERNVEAIDEQIALLNRQIAELEKLKAEMQHTQ